jgi:hypothetical protein
VSERTAWLNFHHAVLDAGLVLQHHKIALKHECLSAKQNPLKYNTCRAESRRRIATTSRRAHTIKIRPV